MKKRNWYFVAAFALACVFAVTLTGCFPLPAASEPEQIELGEIGTINKCEYTVLETSVLDVLSTPGRPSGLTYSESGAEWLHTDLKVKNASTSTKHISASSIKLIIDGTKYSAVTDSYSWYYEGDGNDSIVGKEKVCYLNSSVAIDASFSKTLVILFKFPADADFTDAYIEISYLQDALHMLLS